MKPVQMGRVGVRRREEEEGLGDHGYGRSPRGQLDAQRGIPGGTSALQERCRYQRLAFPASCFLILEVTRSCSALRPHGRSSPGYSVGGTLQARILEWVAISFSRASSRPRD